MFTKWYHDYNQSMKLSQMEHDGQRFRWWRMVCLSNKLVFPGLLANNSLQPFKELKLVSEIYTDTIFQDPQVALDAWRKEKQIFLDPKMGVLRSKKIGGLEFLCNNQHHWYQDKGTRWEASLGRKFVESFDDFEGEKRILFLQLLFAFGPRDIAIRDTKSDKSINVYEDTWRDVKIIPRSSTAIDIDNGSKKFRKLEIENLELFYRRRGLHYKLESKPTNPDIRKFLDWWCGIYQEKFDAKYIIDGKDAKLVQTMLKSIKYYELIELAEKFFDSKDDFVKKAGYTIGVFRSQLNRLSSGKKDKWH